MANLQNDEIVFDFISHLRNIERVDEDVSALEQNLINAFKLSLGVKKMIYFRKIPQKEISLRHHFGFNPSEKTLFIDFFNKIDSDFFNESEFNLKKLDELGTKSVYLISTFVENEVYAIVMTNSAEPSSVKSEIASSLMKSLHLILHEYNVNIHGVATQFSDLILQQIVSGIVVINDKERIVFINRAAEMILGYRLDDIKNSHCSKIFKESDGEKNWLTLTLTTGHLSSRKKIFMLRSDEIEIAVGGTTSLLRNEKNDIIGVVGIFRQFEDFQKDQNRKKDLNKMSTLAKLSGSIAHEIRNPLAGISATAQVLASKFDENDRKHRFVTVILDEIDRINRIIKELLNFASPSKTSFLKSNINKILESALDLLHKKIQKQSIEIVREYDRDLPDIYCDEGQIKQAVLNVMLNSVSAMPDEGILYVATEIVTKNNVDWLKIIVKDTGKGFPEEVLKDIFSPFNSTKTQGLGLGLTITKSIVSSHYGRIEAENLSDTGAQVVIFLPANLQHDYDEQMILSLDATE